MWWTVAVVVVIAAAGAAGVALAASSGSGIDLQTLLVFGLVLVVMVVIVGVVFGFAFWRRRRGSSIFARSPLWELPTQKQRSALLRDLRRGRPIAPERRDLALRVAHDWTRRRSLIWLYLGLVAINGVNAAIDDGWPRWTYLASAVAFLGLAVWFAHLISRMSRAVDRLETDPPAEQRPLGGP